MGTNTRTRLVAGTIAALASCAAECVVAQTPTSTLRSYVTVATGYWRRGLAQNDGPTAQVGIDYDHHAGWFVGARAANVDYEAEYGRRHAREIELDAYAGYHGRGSRWTWTAMLARYAYPGAEGDYDYDYDYSELGVGVGFRDRVFYNATYSDGLVPGLTTLNHELSLAWPVPGGVEIGATVGRFDFERAPADFTHWNVGASKVWARLVFDLRYHDNDYGRATSLGDGADNGYVLSVTYALRRR